MPRFYFELIGKSGATMTPDDEGAEFPDLEAAIADADQGCAEMLAEAVLEGRSADFAAIDIRDEKRKLLTTLRFDETGKRLDAEST
jgi:hypothetical protein